ncbi:hypothetical protein Dsin_017085 [Dipteronia sinensis]|uniref:Uncharacterized protein n=1 Tax=Dipteronia sinensis TaxID=43782 RepID=A0AAE0AEE8_9ROSI|nr:hypothetical protein Dsin_017085 [Dipteronia sinensis]
MDRLEKKKGMKAASSSVLQFDVLIEKIPPSAFQCQLFLKKDLKSLAKKVTSLTNSNSKLKKELEDAKSSEVEAKRVSNEVSVKLSEV